MLITRKQKVCSGCGLMKFIFSGSKCSQCSKKNPTSTSLSDRIFKAKEKKESLSSLKHTLDNWFSRFIRLRDTSNGLARCCTCNKSFPPKDIQCGHYISRGSLALRFHEMNAHANCVKCNILKKGNYIEYVRFMELVYGKEKVLMIESMKNNKAKYGRFEYMVLIADYKAKVEKLLLEKGVEKWWKD